MPWKKSTRSGATGCVEINLDDTPVRVRDSKDPASPEIAFAPPSWRAFVDRVRAGEYDRPGH
jgi:hypothetical protein